MVFILKFFIIFLVLISFTNCKTHVKSSSFNNISCYPIMQKGKNIVIDGKGVAFVSKLLVNKEVSEGKLRILPIEDIKIK